LILYAAGLNTIAETGTNTNASELRLPEKHPYPVCVIYDTDFSTDCDDTAALAMLHGMADMGQAELLAVMISTTDEYSAACADAFNTFCRRPGIPIGARHDLKKEHESSHKGDSRRISLQPSPA
jgi:hypothetical protein